jgi:hypothetical protein
MIGFGGSFGVYYLIGGNRTELSRDVTDAVSIYTGSDRAFFSFSAFRNEFTFEIRWNLFGVSILYSLSSNRRVDSNRIIELSCGWCSLQISRTRASPKKI